MNFHNYISSLQNDNLIIDYNADDQSPINYILRNREKKIVAIGWNTINTYEWPPIEAIIKALSISENELYHWRGILFAVKGNDLWITEAGTTIFPEMYKVNSFEDFWERIKRCTPEVMSDIEKLIKKITLEEYLKKLQLEHPKLGIGVICEEIKTLKAEKIHASESYRGLYSKVEKLEEDLISKENQIHELKDQNENSRNEIDELKTKLENDYIKNELSFIQLKKRISKQQLQTLLKKPFWFPSSETTISLVKKIRVNTDFIRNQIYLKVTFFRLYYTTGGDGIPSGFYPLFQTTGYFDSYFIINEEGVLQISKNNTAIKYTEISDFIEETFFDKVMW